MKQLFTLFFFLLLTSGAFAAPVITVVKTFTPICFIDNVTSLYKIKATGSGSLDINSIISSNNAVMNESSVNYDISIVGNQTYYEFHGMPSAAGTFSLTIELIDDNGVATFTGAVITVQPPAPPSFVADPVTICTSQGKVNLNEYVTVAGSNFQIPDFEFQFENAILETNDSPLSYGQPTGISYTATVGNCNYYVEGTIVLYEAAYADVSTVSTDCNTSEGSAELTTNGEDTPFAIVWTSGQQNTSTVSDLAAGAYSVQVTTAHGCVTNQPFVIDNNGVSAEVISVTDVSCFGGNNGGINVETDGMVQPLNVIWSSGHSTLNIAGLSAGYYTVNIVDAQNCIAVIDAEVYQPDVMEIVSNTNFPVCGEENGDVTVESVYGGVEPFTYQWNTGATDNYIEDIGRGIYSVTVTDANSCLQVKTFYVSDEGGPELYGATTPSNCGMADGSVVTYSTPAFGTEIASVSWSNGALTPDIYNLVPNNYVCTLSGSDGCQTIKGWNIPAAKPVQNNICVVTVDDQTTTNLVVWAKVQTTGIGYYKIYRETSQSGNFALIDTVNASNESIFNDVVASPMQRSWSYKISAVNTCNQEGPLSLPHQTIHLNVLENTATDGVTVGWNAYSGTEFSNYTISRYTTQNGWEELATLPVTQLSFEDEDMPITTPGLDYVVEMELTTMCSSEKAQDFNSSRSNKDRAQFNAGEGTGASSNSVGEIYLNEVKVAPNPASEQLFITQENNAALELCILTLEGQVVQNDQISAQAETIDISGLAPGVYIVKLSLNGMMRNLRFIKL